MGQMINTDEKLVPLNNYPAGLIRMMQEEGVDLAKLLQDTGITEVQLQDFSAHISYAQYTSLIVNSLRAFSKPGLGLHLGKYLHIASNGMMGIAAMTSNTLGDACEIQLAYYKAFSPLMVVDMHISEGKVHFQTHEAWGAGRLLPLAVECLFTGVYHNAKMMLGVDHIDCEIRLAYADPGYSDTYKETLENPVQFGCAVNQLSIDETLLARLLKFRDPNTCQMAKQHCQREYAGAAARQSLVTRVRRVVHYELDRWQALEGHASPLTLVFVAEELFMSPRTLKRKLSSLGTSYQKVKETILLERADAMLQDKGITVADIAQRLQFSDTANFRRAFKRWTGKTPLLHRQELLRVIPRDGFTE